MFNFAEGSNFIYDATEKKSLQIYSKNQVSGVCSLLLIYVSSFFVNIKHTFFKAFKHIKRIQNGLKCLQNGILMILSVNELKLLS